MTDRALSLWLLPFQDIELIGIARLEQYLDVPGDTLLHAGPPYASVREVPLPVLQAACQVLVIDQLADSIEHAMSLIRANKFKFSPAQSYGVVTPLAQVVSKRSWVFEVRDRNANLTGYAPLVEGAPPALRFGSATQATREAMLGLDQLVAELGPCLEQQPIALAPVIAEGLVRGDECHAITLETHKALMSRLPDAPDRLLTQYGFVLPIVMAASSVALRRSGTIKAIGGNGVTIGWQPAAQPVWQQLVASPPTGEMFNDSSFADVLPAIGDSAVIDFAGLGAQALDWSPQMQKVWQTYLPNLRKPNRSQLLDPATGLVCINPIVMNDAAPAVHLAMVSKRGSGQILGRGAIQVDPDLFDLCANSKAWAMMPWP